MEFPRTSHPAKLERCNFSINLTFLKLYNILMLKSFLIIDGHHTSEKDYMIDNNFLSVESGI